MEAFPDEKLDKWLIAHVNALRHIGGVPRVIVPDNCKPATTKPSYYDPVINKSYWQFAKHYEVAILPARVREPRDKAPVESSIGWLETWLLEWLRDKHFFSFETLDKPALRPLPWHRIEYADFAVRRTPANYHVEYGGFHYSVPHGLHKQLVTIRATAMTIEIMNGNRERVAVHSRRQKGSRHATYLAHMPAHHRHQHDANRFDGDKYRMWAKNIGVQTYTAIDRMLSSQVAEEQAYRSSMGVLQCAKKYGDERLGSACSKAIGMNSCTYTTITTILKSGQDKVAAPAKSRSTPLHKNPRESQPFV